MSPSYEARRKRALRLGMGDTAGPQPERLRRASLARDDSLVLKTLKADDPQDSIVKERGHRQVCDFEIPVRAGRSARPSGSPAPVGARPPRDKDSKATH